MQVLLFGKLAEMLGSTRLEVPNMTHTQELLDYLNSTYTHIQSIGFVLAVNRNIVQQCNLNPADEIALLPPFSGG